MIECAHYTIGVIEVQYSQIDYVHIYIHHQTTNHKPINFDRHHAAIPKKWTDIHITHCQSLYNFLRCLLSYLGKCQKSRKSLGKSLTTALRTVLLIFSCSLVCKWRHISQWLYMCYKQALVYFQRQVNMWVTECDKSVLRLPSLDIFKKRKKEIRVSLQKNVLSISI